MDRDLLKEILASFLDKKDQELIEKAYLFAEKAHAGHKRFSGEPYITHLAATAKNLIEFGSDAETVAAGLLHDVIEDCNVSAKTLTENFGQNITQMVEGVSKLGGLKYSGRDRYAENMRHLFLAIAQDIRVVLIKLADRKHNIETIQYVPEEKKRRIALETLEIYAPLANRLGMGKLTTTLREHSFPYAYPEAYREVEELLKEKGREREDFMQKVNESLEKELKKAGIMEARLSYRIKDHYSIYHKLLDKDMDAGKIYDIYALRVIVPSIEDCYRVLGVIHGLFKPLPGRIKDYISNPKTNGYQSLHTTVFAGDQGIAEIQIRTPEMHLESEYGIAAHIVYKDKENTGKKTIQERLSWLSRIRDLHERHTSSPADFLKHLKFDFFDKRVFAFTPRGDVIELPEGASVLDFAFRIHSDIGNHTSGARVNGKFVSLDHVIQNGDIVEIETKKSARPTRRWLSYAKTGLALKHIRAAFSQET